MAQSTLALAPADPVDGSGVKIRGGVIRWNRVNGRSEPYIYTNDAHPAPGLADASLNADKDVVITPTSGFTPVIFCSAAPDETLARLGVIAGCSVGNTAIMRFSRGGVQIPGDDPVLSTTGANIWLLVISKA